MIKHGTNKDLDLINSFLANFNQKPIDDVRKNQFSDYLLYYNDDDKCVGFMQYSLIYDRMEIDYIYVNDNYRKSGIASHMLRFLDRIARLDECINISLEVSKENEAAIKLYEKNGFRQVAIRERYYDGIDGLLLLKEVKQMTDINILAIESSCDETSVSIIKNGDTEVHTVVLSQMDTHANFGGVVPEIASRMHIENITMVIEECLTRASMTMDDITAIAVTYGPGLIGSLLIGLQAAKTLAYIYDKPLIPVHHIAGHIYANNLVEPMQFPLVALVVSGGHTDLVYMESDYSFKKIGGTLDDAVGEAYDKVARVIGMPYPGGPVVDKAAHVGNDTYDLPLPLDDDTYNFSFSGLKSAVINVAHNEEQRGNAIRPEDLACSFQNRVVEILTKKTMKAIKEYGVNSLILAGGVAANKGLRERLTKECEEHNIHLCCPPIKYCTDNAAMIGAAGFYAYKYGRIADLDLNAKATDKLY